MQRLKNGLFKFKMDFLSSLVNLTIIIPFLKIIIDNFCFILITTPSLVHFSNNSDLFYIYYYFSFHLLSLAANISTITIAQKFIPLIFCL